MQCVHTLQSCKAAVARTLVYHWMASLGMPWAVIWSISSDLMRGNTSSNLCLAMAGGCWGAGRRQGGENYLEVG